MAKPTTPSTATQQLAFLADEAFISGNRSQCIKAIDLLYQMHSLPPSKSPAQSAESWNTAFNQFIGA